jgi:hypothetical protein
MNSPQDVDGTEIEKLIKAIEDDGLPHSMAMGELLRALLSQSQTLQGHHAGLTSDLPNKTSRRK